MLGLIDASHLQFHYADIAVKNIAPVRTRSEDSQLL